MKHWQLQEKIAVWEQKFKSIDLTLIQSDGTKISTLSQRLNSKFYESKSWPSKIWPKRIS